MTNPGANATASATTSDVPASSCTCERRGRTTTPSRSSAPASRASPAKRRSPSTNHGVAAYTASALHRPVEIICAGSGTAAYTPSAAMRDRFVANDAVSRQIPSGPSTRSPMTPRVWSRPMWNAVATLATAISA